MPIDADHERTDLQGQVDELSRTIDRLQQELSDLRARQATETAGSRRDLLKLVGGAAAVGALAGTVGGGAPRALALTGQPLVVGNGNSAANITYIAYGSFANFPTNPLTAEATMFWVDNRNSPLGNANGIRGDGKGTTGAGLWGHSDFGGIGVLATGGLALNANGSRAAAYLSGNNAAPIARTDAHTRGEVDIDLNGDLWLCTASGTPGAWRKLAGPNTAGAFHPINPVRVYDTRFPGGTRIGSGQDRIISVADGHDVSTGAINAPNVVPVGATAIAYNLTVTQTALQGFLSVTPGNATGITASSINWQGTGLDIANGLIVQLDTSRQVRVFAGGGGNTDFLIDVTGYFM